MKPCAPVVKKHPNAPGCPHSGPVLPEVGLLTLKSSRVPERDSEKIGIGASVKACHTGRERGNQL